MTHHVTARLAMGRTVDNDAFTDLLDAAMVSRSFDEQNRLVVEFDRDLTPEEAGAVADRIEARNSNEETLRRRVRAAGQTNRSFVANRVPQILSATEAIIKDTAATSREVNLAKAMQALANQAEEAARQRNALIRIVLGALDGTD